MKHPLILGWDTSAEELWVFLFLKGKTYFTSKACKGRHQENLLDGAEALLKRHRLKARDLDALSVSVGPGSFTGIRVGVAAAKTWSYAWDIPLIGLGSLDLVAECIEADNRRFWVARNARRAKLYVARYQERKRLEGPRLEELEDFVKSHSGPNELIVYDGVDERGFKGIHSSGIPRSNRAWGWARLSLEAWYLRNFADPASLSPVYVYDERCQVIKSKRAGACA